MRIGVPLGGPWLIIQEVSKDDFNAKLETLIASAKHLRGHGFDKQHPEEATKQLFLEPLFHALGYQQDSNYAREFKILGDSVVDYLLKSERPLMFVEAKPLVECWTTSLFETQKNKTQVLRYIHDSRLSPEVTKMERPVVWILLTNFAQFHFIRVNETTPTGTRLRFGVERGAPAPVWRIGFETAKEAPDSIFSI
jgi:hypothetical protein